VTVVTQHLICTPSRTCNKLTYLLSAQTHACAQPSIATTCRLFAQRNG
jgi:hypothetical protein